MARDRREALLEINESATGERGTYFPREFESVKPRGGDVCDLKKTAIDLRLQN